MKKHEIQELINKKAELKLDADIKKLLEFSTHPLFQLLENDKVVFNDGEKDLTTNFRSFFWNYDKTGVAKDRIKKLALQKYIDAESKSFFDKIERMQNEMNNLLNDRYQDED